MLLFDGVSMNHWNDPRKLNPPGNGWTIEDGCLKALPTANINEDLISRDTYRDFELAWDWRISRGGNSGVKYRVQGLPVLDTAERKPGVRGFENMVNEALKKQLFQRSAIAAYKKPQIYVIGFEYQILDNAANEDAKVGGIHQTGALYDILAPSRDASLPVGQFNHSRVLVRGNHFEHWLNGTKVVDVDVNAEMLRTALDKRWGENSPVADLLARQPKKDCPITLQNHNSAAWFRDIKIRKL